MDQFYKNTLRAVRAVIGSLALLIITASTSNAQRVQVQGTITDATDGTPLVGVNIIVKSTANGTITDSNGKYALEVESSDVLVASFIGYLSEEIVVGSRTTIDIVLKANSTSLEEVVVVGFGEQRKSNLSGAVDVIDNKAMEGRPIQSIGQGLQGAIPNLNIDFVSGEPGVAPNINIRGITSINGGNPLILVDNVPMDAKDLNFIAPADVKSVSVLKDAASAAIYGARAAYGVILITTKSGMRDGVSIDYSNNFSWGKPTVLPNKITDPYIYMRMLETSTDNTPWDYVDYSDEQYAWAKDRSDNPSGTEPVRLNPIDNTLWDYMGNKDWTKHLLDNPTFSQRHNLALSGKSGTTTYYLSGAYDSQNGAIKIAEDKFDRYSFRGKVNFKPFEWLSLGNNTSFALTERAKPTYLNIQNMFNLSPTSWDVNPDGTWANNDVGRLSAQLTDGGRDDQKINMLQSTFSGELSFFERLLRVNADFTVRRDNTSYTQGQTKYKIGYGPSDIREEGNNLAYREGNYLSYYVLNTYATLEKTLSERHYLNAIVGYNQEYNRYEEFWTQRLGVISSSLPSIGLATGETTADEEILDWAIRGAFYRLNYIYNEKYILELNGRYDGSSKFPKDKRFGFFPSVSAAWRVDGEHFWQPISKVVNTFKIRASYGSLGNQSAVPEYGYIETMPNSQGSYLIDGTRPTVISSPRPVSPNYTWEKLNELWIKNP